MAFLSGTTSKIQTEDVTYRSAPSDGLLSKMGIAINNSIDNELFSLGDIITSALTEELFTSARAGWALMDGRDITGSDYAILTGITTLPDFVSQGAHMEQLEAGNSIFDFFPNQNQEHDHRNGSFNRLLRFDTRTIYVFPTGFVTTNFNTTDTIDTSPIEPDLVNSSQLQDNGGDRFRPDSFQINHFIKINDVS
jgi:hypothetical protein